MSPLIFFALMLVLFWVLIVLPQRRRRQRQSQCCRARGRRGDHRRRPLRPVHEVADDYVVLEIAPETRIRVAKSAVAARTEPEQEPAEPPETSLP